MPTPALMRVALLGRAGVACLCALLCGAPGGCTRQQADRGALPEMGFDSDPALLGAAVGFESAGLALSPPRGWAPVSASVRDTLAAVLRRDAVDQAVWLEPVGVFADSDQGAVLSVARVRSAQPPLGGAGLVEEHCRRVRSRFASASTREAEYARLGVRVVQFLVEDGQSVTFKLVFASPDSEVLQLDYVVPRKAYAAVARAIESSIGSIHLVQPQQRRSRQ